MKITCKPTAGCAILLLFGIAGIVTFINVKKHADCSFYHSRLIVTHYDMGGYLLHEGRNSESLDDFIASYTNKGIEIVSGKILDYYKTPIRYVVEKHDDGIFVGIYGAGRDKVWGTNDDFKREGTFLEDPIEGEQ